MIHLDIRDGKVCVQCNNTDQNIVEELVAEGVAREDIILPTPPKVQKQPKYTLATMRMAANHLPARRITNHHQSSLGQGVPVTNPSV